MAVVEALRDYSKFVNIFSSKFVRSIEEECEVSWCTRRLESDNRLLINAFLNWQQSLGQLITAFSDLGITSFPFNLKFS